MKFETVDRVPACPTCGHELAKEQQTQIQLNKIQKVNHLLTRRHLCWDDPLSKFAVLVFHYFHIKVKKHLNEECRQIRSGQRSWHIIIIILQLDARKS